MIANIRMIMRLKINRVLILMQRNWMAMLLASVKYAKLRTKISKT